jgi:hypothetical protein
VLPSEGRHGRDLPQPCVDRQVTGFGSLAKRPVVRALMGSYVKRTCLKAFWPRQRSRSAMLTQAHQQS